MDDFRKGASLEDKFLEIVGGANPEVQRLSWLEG